MKKLHRILDSITMYRVMLYSLSFLVFISLALSALDILTYSSFSDLLLTLGLISVIGFTTNQVLSRAYGIPVNLESGAITSCILYFVLATPSNKAEWIGIGLASAIAIASKFVITWRGAHIFNPAAFGVIAVSLIGVGSGAWWIATESLFLPMLLVTTLVLVKLRRFQVFFAFLVPALVLIILNTSSSEPLSTTLVTALTLYPLLFLGSIMLTEPATMPNTRYMSVLYALIVGFLLGSTVDIGPFEASPHLALLVGNIFAFIVSARSGAFLTLVEKKQLTPTTVGFSFKPSRPITHTAGQYMEFTLPGVNLDSRGNRRTFTVASSPTDELIRISVKFYDKGSQFKDKLASLKVGDKIMGGHVGGDFVMPESEKTPLVFVAGGIGVTPFIAMIEDIVEKDMQRQIDLYYFAIDQSELAFKEVLKSGQKHGVTIHPRIGKDSRLTPEDISAHADADFYLSGPPGMVNAYKAQLIQQKIKHIHTDLFTGY